MGWISGAFGVVGFVRSGGSVWKMDKLLNCWYCRNRQKFVEKGRGEERENGGRTALILLRRGG